MLKFKFKEKHFVVGVQKAKRSGMGFVVVVQSRILFAQI